VFLQGGQTAKAGEKLLKKKKKNKARQTKASTPGPGKNFLMQKKEKKKIRRAVMVKNTVAYQGRDNE